MEGDETGSDGVWRFALLSSPWWDCPIFDYLLWKPEGRDDRDLGRWDPGTVLEKRVSRHVELERDFLNTWDYVATTFPMRRFSNGDAVLPLTRDFFREKYGDKAMKWNIINEADETDGAEGIVGLANVSIQDTNDASRERETIDREMDVPVDCYDNDGKRLHDSSEEDRAAVAGNP